jgi:translation initiation factor IF-3
MLSYITLGTAQRNKSKDKRSKVVIRESSIEEQINDHNEKDSFDELIKYTKKGDRVGFITAIER